MKSKKKVNLLTPRKKQPLTPDELRREHNFYEDGTPLSGPDTIAKIRARTDTILLSFSTGKDSVAAWLVLREHFPNIQPYYLWLLPEMPLVEDSLKRYEDFFGTHIIRLPHPAFWYWLNNYMWMPPERCLVVEAAGIPFYTLDQLTTVIKQRWNMPPETWVATGVRAADSPTRRSATTQYGPINWRRKYFWPIWDMNKATLIDLIAKSGTYLGKDYVHFGRSWDGVDYRFSAVLRDKEPESYEILRQWFPLVELEMFRYETIDKNRRARQAAREKGEVTK